MPTPDSIRCPYCVEDYNFKLMNDKFNGVFVCENCGHATAKTNLMFICHCQKCRELSIHQASIEGANRVDRGGS